MTCRKDLFSAALNKNSISYWDGTFVKPNEASDGFYEIFKASELAYCLTIKYDTASSGDPRYKVRIHNDIAFNKNYEDYLTWEFTPPSNVINTGSHDTYIGCLFGNGYTIYGFCTSSGTFMRSGWDTAIVQNIRFKNCYFTNTTGQYDHTCGPLRYGFLEVCNVCSEECLMNAKTSNVAWQGAFGILDNEGVATEYQAKYKNNYSINCVLKGVSGYYHSGHLYGQGSRSNQNYYNAYSNPFYSDYAYQFGTAYSYDGDKIKNFYRPPSTSIFGDVSGTTTNCSQYTTSEMKSDTFKNLLNVNASSDPDCEKWNRKDGFPYLFNWVNKDIEFSNKTLVFSCLNGVICRANSEEDKIYPVACITNNTTSMLRRLVYSKQYGGFVVTDTTNSKLLVCTRKDGYVWSSISVSGLTTPNSICETDTSLVVVGNSGKIFTYSSGVWVSRTSGITANILNVGFVNNILFVSGGAGTLLKSIDDGVTWVSKTSGVTTEIHSCAYSPSLNIYVMGTSGSVFLYSTDEGETWTSFTLGITNCTILKILWIESLNIFVACASGGYVFTSTTGKIWSNVYLNAAGTSLYSLCFDENTKSIIVVGYSGFCLRSYDGISWSVVTQNSGISFRDVIYVDTDRV